MGQIHVLDFHVANLIAAGEVVDRPASVVKELLENAIDAGGDTITVEIKRGGVSFIRVSDNGCGMSREDVPIALKRHATSKIKDAQDLDTIATLGFRGEALAAISSVSQLRIMTKRREDATGTMMESSGGRVLSVTDAGCPEGTTVIVENLFFNTPARLKFLKKDGTEAANVAAYVEKIALSHPEITLRFITDGELKYATVGDNNRRSTIYAILGRDFSKKMLEINGGFDGIAISGFIGTPENIRGNRNLQIFFINNRFIRSKTISAALEQAFTTYIPSEKFPCAVLYLRMNPTTVDVNVHPAKLEVKFSNERAVFESVYYAVRGALEQNLSRPEMKWSDAMETLQTQKKQEQRETVNAFTAGKEGSSGEGSKADILMRRTVWEGAAENQNAETALSAMAKETDRYSEKDHVTVEPLFAEDMPMSIPGHIKEMFAEKAMPDAESDQNKDRTEDCEASATDNAANQTQTAASAVIETPKEEILKAEAASVPSVSCRINEPVSVQTPQSAGEFIFPPQKDAEKEPPQNEPAKTEHIRKPEEKASYRIVGEVFQCYVILEAENTMYLVDKHAAHERILFESFKACGKQIGAQHGEQILLMPLIVPLSTDEMATVDDFREELMAAGYAFDMQAHAVHITQVPSFLDTAEAKDAFCEAVTHLTENSGTPLLTREQKYEKALFQASCKAAIKAGRNYDEAHLRWICDRVMNDPEIRYCPHGRPVCFEMTKSAIESRFGRT